MTDDPEINFTIRDENSALRIRMPFSREVVIAALNAYFKANLPPHMVQQVPIDAQMSTLRPAYLELTWLSDEALMPYSPGESRT